MTRIAFHCVTKSVRTRRTSQGILGDILSRHAGEQGNRVLFKELSFESESGEIVLIVGRNGSGKTTLLRMMAGLAQWDSGKILLDGMGARQFDRKSLGIAFSISLLYPGLTGYENLEHSAWLYGCENVQEAVEQQAEKWGLGNYLHQKVRTYSNGMRVMLALARATIHWPRLLLLDEPTAYLDSPAVERLLKCLKSIRATVVIATQQPKLFDPLAGGTPLRTISIPTPSYV